MQPIVFAYFAKRLLSFDEWTRRFDDDIIIMHASRLTLRTNQLYLSNGRADFGPASTSSIFAPPL